MREGSKWLHLLLAGLLACSLALAGCSGDDGDDGRDGKDFELPPAQTAGLLACSTCHGTGSAANEWKASKHAMNSSHTIGSCAAECHNPSDALFDMDAAFGVAPTGTVVGCEDCHGPGSNHVDLPYQAKIAYTAPGVDVCGQCHDATPHAARHVYAPEIASRFATSRHANQHARTAFCSACHSHEGGVLLLSQQRFTDIEDLVDFYNSENVPFYNLPEAVDAEDGVGVNVKTCATCHDPHTTGLRGDGDIVETVLWDGVEEEATVYSAEFNLCTACHMVDLDATPAGHGDAGVLFEYTLSEKYLKENLVDAESGTWKEVDIDGRGLTKVSNVFYHDGTSANNRHFVDTHFGGTMYSSLYNIGAADTEFVDMDVKGYNVNAANPNACTVCHDPHTGGKMLSPVEPENNDNAAIGYAEGLGDFHTNHLGAAQGHGCTPCHSGDSFVPMTTMGTPASAPTTSVIGCRSCHNLAVANAAPGSNNAEAFAQVREFQPGYEFAFESGAVADVADLGVNQICFECHKGRTGVKPDAGTTTQVYGVSYLHYAPSMAILFGDESQMVPTYEGKTYAGKFVHGGGAVNGVTEFGCVDCHDVHNTDGNDVVQNKMATSANCSGCHKSGALFDADVLRDRTVAYGQRLLDTIRTNLETQVGTNNDAALIIQGINGENFDFDTFVSDAGTALNTADKLAAFSFEDLFGSTSNAADITEAAINARLMTYLTGSTRDATGSRLVNNALAKAGSIWKIFNYEDGSPHGITHGHGGSWAHNSQFARQVQWDAIEDLGGSTDGLTASGNRP